MGLFDFLKKKEAKVPTNDVVALTTGTLVDISTVSDPVFSEKAMGDGFAIEPSNGNICSPIDGEIAAIFPTGHAFGVKRADGLEVLVHIGIDTVELNGKGFTKVVKQGDKVCAGDVCIKVDLAAVKAAGYSVTTMNIFTGGFAGTTESLNYGASITSGETVIADVKAVVED